MGTLGIAIRNVKKIDDELPLSIQILHKYQVRIVVEQLGSHRMAQLMARFRQLCFLGITLYAFLN
jgi:hypothetical protein